METRPLPYPTTRLNPSFNISGQGLRWRLRILTPPQTSVCETHLATLSSSEQFNSLFLQQDTGEVR